MSLVEVAAAAAALPVSHLPQSTSFFLSALQPLGYRYLGQRGGDHQKQIGLGVDEPDFYLYQERQGSQTGTAEIVFSGPSRVVVDTFYAAALRAGAVSQVVPGLSATSNERERREYGAAVFDIDGNSVRVVCWDDDEIAENNNISNDHMMDDRRSLVSARRVGSSSASRSRVLSWQQNVARSTTTTSGSDRRSAVPTTIPRARISVPVIQPVPRASTNHHSDFSSTKALIGTLLGAAGGAAVAYAMMRAESEDEAERERAAMRARPTHQIVMIDREVVPVEEERPTRRQLDAPGIVSTRSNSGSTTPRPTAVGAAPARSTPRSVVSASSAARPSEVGTDGSLKSQRVGSRVAVAEEQNEAGHAASTLSGPLDTLGTLISTFIPPSSVPRLLPGVPSPSAGPSSSSSSSSLTTITSKTSHTVPSAKDVPLPASVVSTTTTTTSSHGPSKASRKSTATTKTTGTGHPSRTTPTTKEEGSSASASASTSTSTSTSASQSTIKAARNVPLPNSSRASLVTVTPSESISNVSSRRSLLLPSSSSSSSSSLRNTEKIVQGGGGGGGGGGDGSSATRTTKKAIR